MDDFSKNGVDPLNVSLYQMDLDRIMYILRSFIYEYIENQSFGSIILCYKFGYALQNAFDVLTCVCDKMFLY